MGRIAGIAIALLLSTCAALAQGQVVRGQAQRLATTNSSVSITTGNTFQTITLPTPSNGLQSLTIQNNNTNGDNCWVFIGSAAPTAAASIILGAGGSYTRYWPYIPSDVLKATCATTADTLYVDTQ